jgi:hypothetical protein
MEERYHATTQNQFYPNMSNVNKNITVEAKLNLHILLLVLLPDMGHIHSVFLSPNKTHKYNNFSSVTQHGVHIHTLCHLTRHEHKIILVLSHNRHIGLYIH